MSNAIEQRARRRELRRRAMLLAAFSGFGAKAAMFLPSILLAAFAVPVMGNERFGVLMTIVSLQAVLGMADLGVGSSLVTSMSRAFGANDQDMMRRLQGSGLVVVASIAVVLLALAMLAVPLQAGGVLFPNSSYLVRREATEALAIFGAMFAVNLPLSLVGKIQLSIGRGHVPNYWQILAAIINFGAASAAAHFDFGIPAVVAGLLGGTLLCGVLNLLLHLQQEPELRFGLRDLRAADVRAILRESMYYLGLQAIFAVAYAADTTLVARQLGPESAATYALCERVFGIIGVGVAVLTGPLWAAYAEALGANDESWSRRVLLASTVRIGAAALLLSTMLLFTLEPFLGVLTSGHIIVPAGLALAMSIWRVIEALGGSLSAYMYARQAIRFVLVIGMLTAAISFIGKVILIPQIGVVAVPFIMICTYLVFCLLPSVLYVRRATFIGLPSQLKSEAP